jgi:hypothetical protein
MRQSPPANFPQAFPHYIFTSKCLCERAASVDFCILLASSYSQPPRRAGILASARPFQVALRMLDSRRGSRTPQLVPFEERNFTGMRLPALGRKNARSSGSRTNHASQQPEKNNVLPFACGTHPACPAPGTLTRGQRDFGFSVKNAHCFH